MECEFGDARRAQGFCTTSICHQLADVNWHEGGSRGLCGVRVGSVPDLVKGGMQSRGRNSRPRAGAV